MGLFDAVEYSRIEFTYTSSIDGVRHEASIVLNDKEHLSDLVRNFKYFLNAMGFTYVDAVVAFKDGGGEVSSED